MDEVLPLFKSHYSLGRSILTLGDDGSAPDESDSSFDICKENEMNEVVVVVASSVFISAILVPSVRAMLTEGVPDAPVTEIACILNISEPVGW